jgi:hypothetical protein
MVANENGCSTEDSTVNMTYQRSSTRMIHVVGTNMVGYIATMIDQQGYTKDRRNGT